LQCVAVCCSGLHFAAVGCNMLQCGVKGVARYLQYFP